MKKSSLISLLPQILLNHKEWFESKGNRGIFADLSEEYLREGNFQNAVLVEANFQGADLRSFFIILKARRKQQKNQKLKQENLLIGPNLL